MVSATKRRDVVRVEFKSPVSISNRSEADIVCYLHMTPTGLTTYYSHHAIRDRDTEKGPFDGEQLVRLPLNQSLQSQINMCVMSEFWDAFSRRILTLPEQESPTTDLLSLGKINA